MARVEILGVGTELLLGELVDTNTPHIAKALSECGIDVFYTHSVGDNQQRIAAVIRSALDRSDGVISTGGLGPTIDDVTKEAVCEVLGLKTQCHQPSLASIEATFRRLGREMRENNRKQAELPEGATVLENPHGTAPGFIVCREDGKFVACMPGVPREMMPMLEEKLLPWLHERFNSGTAIHTRTLHTINIAESEIDHRIADMFQSSENPKIAVLAHDYRCDVKISAKAGSEEDAIALIAPVEHEIVRRLTGHVFGVDDQTLPGAIHALLHQTHRTLAVAESVTGGAIAAALTSVPGASKHFAGGVVAYANSAKSAILGVQERTLQTDGAVSEQAAIEMAMGVRTRFDSTVGLSVTGIAGPTGGTAEKPVGLVWFAIADGTGARAVRAAFLGDRQAIQRRATVGALGLLWETLGAGEPIAAGAS